MMTLNTLGAARRAYSHALVILLYEHMPRELDYAFDQGKVPAEGSVHMKGSLHESGLATDILLYRDGNYLMDTDDYRELGERWEALGTERGLDLAWGGRFSKPDGNHFSLRWNGKA